MAPNETTTLPFGWAGFLIEIPDVMRLGKIQRHARRGIIRLIDDRELRLELAWGMPRVGSDPLKALRKFLIKALPRHQRTGVRDQIQTLQARAPSNLDPLIYFGDDERESEYWAGYCPATRRAVQVVHHKTDSKKQNQLVRDAVRQLIDQPTDQPQRWSFFSHRLTTPAGFAHQEATLNVGDMMLNLRDVRHRFTRGRIRIRLIYPADLALKRKPIEDWFKDMVTGERSVHLPRHRGLFRRGGLRVNEIDTPHGKALTTDARLPLIFAAFAWTTPRYRRHVIHHDQPAGRIVYLAIADRRHRLDDLVTDTLGGLHWSGTEDHG